MRHDPDGSAKLLIRPTMVGQVGAGDHDDRSIARTPPKGESMSRFGSVAITSTDTGIPAPGRPVGPNASFTVGLADAGRAEQDDVLGFGDKVGPDPGSWTR